MTTLKDVMLATYEELGMIKYGIATGGSATTCVDSGLTGGEKDDFKGSTLFINYDAGGASAAPEGEFTEVTAYTRATGTLTFASGGLSTAPASGDEYAVSDPRLPTDKMKGLINRAMQKIGDHPDIDTSLTTASGQTEYALPAGVKGGRLRQVSISQSSDTNDYEWLSQDAWYERPGETNDLVFRLQPDVGYTLSLLYMKTPTRLRVYSDTISNFIRLERIVAEAVYLYYKQLMRTTEGRAETLVDNMRDAIQELENAKKMYPVMEPALPWKPLLTSGSDYARRDARRGQYGPWNPNA